MFQKSYTFDTTLLKTSKRRPFMFTFLFDLRTPSLSLPSFYRSIHHQLGPLQRPLLSSTSPHNVYRRIQLSDAEQSSNGKTGLSIAENPIYDLIYDPSNLTVRSSIPNIPEPGIETGPSSTYTSPFASPVNNNGRDKWTRIEALNVHSQFLSAYTDTRLRPLEMERTCKTSRGWWLVWVRVNDNHFHQTDHHHQPVSFKEAFLVRKASDSLSSLSAASARQSRGGGSSGVRFLRDLSGASSSLGPLDFSHGHNSGSSNTTAPGKLAEGLGLDAHKYIESLLSLNK